MKMGMGLVPFTYYQSDQKLVNLLDQKAANFPAQKPGFTYSRDGWPTKFPVGKQFPENWPGWGIGATEGYLKPGKYEVWAGGNGRFTFAHPDIQGAGKSSMFESKGQPIGGPHRKIGEFDVVHDDAPRTLFSVFGVDEANPLSHIMVVPAGEKTSDVFTKQYVEELSHFSALRMAGYTGVINSKEVDWPSGPIMPAGNPARWLAGMRLCNETGCDAWYNIPHMASDQYVKTLASLTNFVLHPDRTVYFEYSIEIWNWGYPFGVATKWVEDWGKAQVPPITPYQWAAVERAHHLQEVFCTEAPSRKVVRMFGDQHWYPALFEQAGQYMTKKGYHFDAVATAPYVGPVDLVWGPIDAKLAAGDQKGALDILFAETEKCIAKIDPFAAQYRQIADKLKVPKMLTYECGASFSAAANGPKSRVDLVQPYHQDPRIHDFFMNTYFPWMAKYYDLAMYTSHTAKSLPGEAWGVKETAGQVPAPKLDACLEWCAKYNGKA